MKKVIVIAGMLFAAGAVASPFEKPSEAIEYRQAAFSMIATNFGDMANMVKGRKDWDQAQFSQRAQFIAQLAQMPEEAFQFKGAEAGDTTKAKPAIWSDWSGFNAKLTQFQTDMNQLAKVSLEGDERATKKAFGVAAKNCKSCHSDYKYK